MTHSPEKLREWFRVEHGPGDNEVWVFFCGRRFRLHDIRQEYRNLPTHNYTGHLPHGLFLELWEAPEEPPKPTYDRPKKRSVAKGFGLREPKPRPPEKRDVSFSIKVNPDVSGAKMWSQIIQAQEAAAAIGTLR